MISLKNTLIIAYRFMVVLFRKDRVLRKFYLEYPQNYIFKNGYLVLKYRFQNALYYRIGNKIITSKIETVIDLSAFNGEIEFEAIGFFQKSLHRIRINSDLLLDSNNFQTTFNKLEVAEVNCPIVRIVPQQISVYDNVPAFSPTPLKVREASIKVNQTLYNQTDFI